MVNKHQKAVIRIQKQAGKSLETFRRIENDLAEANNDLHDIVTSIDIEMDRLAALRIETQKQIMSNDTAIQNIGALLGKGASRE